MFQEVSYEMTQVGSPCDAEQYEINSKEECKQAGENLGLVWGGWFSGSNDFPACLYADDGRSLVFYNKSPNPDRTNFSPKYSAICKEKGRKFFPTIYTMYFVIIRYF